jgi:hypothetical protein
MARIGHDSERAAINYHHEAPGADLAITNVIDIRIGVANTGQGEDGEGMPEAQLKPGNGPANGP